MPVRTTIRRMNKFEANYDTDAIRQSLERQRDGIIEQQKVKQAELEKVDNQTKLILGDESVSSSLYLSYLNFARQIWKIKNRYTSGTLKLEADIILDKWTRRGLNEDVLKRIRDTVFTLEAPTP